MHLKNKQKWLRVQIGAAEKQGEKLLVTLNAVDLYANKKDSLLFFKTKEILNDLCNKIFYRKDRLSNEIDFNDLDYIYKKSSHISNFEDFISSLNFCGQIKKWNYTWFCKQ